MKKFKSELDIPVDDALSLLTGKTKAVAPFSLRQMLQDQGVHPVDIPRHMRFIFTTMQAARRQGISFDIKRYRVNPNDTSQPYQG